MYQPKFNHVLVEIDDKDSVWGKSGETSMGGDSYREGTLLEVGERIPTAEYPMKAIDIASVVGNTLNSLIGKQIMWNQGHEAGTVFEENGKKYALIYWWDVVGVKDEQ